MVKVYVRRNINDLAELGFGKNKRTCNCAMIRALLIDLSKSASEIKNVPSWESLDKQFKKHKKIYIGEWSKDEVEFVLGGVGVSKKDRKWFRQHLEFK